MSFYFTFMPAAFIFNSKVCQHKLVDLPFAFLLSEKPLAHVETLVFVPGSDSLYFLLPFLPNGFFTFDPNAAQKLYQHLSAELLRMRDEKVYDFFLIVSQGENPFQHAEHGAGPLCRIGKCTFLVSSKHAFCRALPGNDVSVSKICHCFFVGCVSCVYVEVEMPQDHKIPFSLRVGEHQVLTQILCGIALQ